MTLPRSLFLLGCLVLAGLAYLRAWPHAPMPASDTPGYLEVVDDLQDSSLDRRPLPPAGVPTAPAPDRVAIVAPWPLDVAGVALYAAANTMVLYTMIVSSFLHHGEARFRQPIEGLLIASTALGVGFLKRLSDDDPVAGDRSATHG